MRIIIDVEELEDATIVDFGEAVEEALEEHMKKYVDESALTYAKFTVELDDGNS